jgi:hypothetical protein
MKTNHLLCAVAAVTCAMLWSGDAEAACKDGRNRRVKVINETSYTMVRLYGSRQSADSWQEDVLGEDVLKPGQSVNVNWDDGTCACTFDFKAAFSDKTETVRRGYDVCEQATWRIHE